MNEITREIVRKIDAEIEAATKGQEQVKIGEIVKPYITKYADEAGLDPIDLFIDYMDHLSLTSKQSALNKQGEIMLDESDLDNPNFRLY